MENKQEVMLDKDEGLSLTPEEMCDELNRDHKVGQIFFIPNRLRTHLPYYKEIMCLLEAQLAKAKSHYEDEDYDPQAEMYGSFLDMGWTPPAELKTKIEEAKKQERERIIKVTDEYCLREIGYAKTMKATLEARSAESSYIHSEETIITTLERVRQALKGEK